MAKSWPEVIITGIVALFGIGKLVHDELKEANETERKKQKKVNNN